MSRKQILILSFPVVLLIGVAIWFLFYCGSSEDMESKPAISSSEPTSSVESKPPISKQDRRLSEQIANQFLRVYTHRPVDFDDIKDYITLYWYNQMNGMHMFRRNTSEVQTNKLLSILRCDSEATYSGIKWTFEVREEVTDADGHKKVEEKVYELHMIKQATWKVDEVHVHGTID